MLVIFVVVVIVLKEHKNSCRVSLLLFVNMKCDYSVICLCVVGPGGLVCIALYCSISWICIVVWTGYSLYWMAQNFSTIAHSESKYVMVTNQLWTYFVNFFSCRENVIFKWNYNYRYHLISAFRCSALWKHVVSFLTQRGKWPSFCVAVYISVTCIYVAWHVDVVGWCYSRSRQPRRATGVRNMKSLSEQFVRHVAFRQQWTAENHCHLHHLHPSIQVLQSVFHFELFSTSNIASSWKQLK